MPFFEVTWTFSVSEVTCGHVIASTYVKRFVITKRSMCKNAFTFIITRYTKILIPCRVRFILDHLDGMGYIWSIGNIDFVLAYVSCELKIANTGSDFWVMIGSEDYFASLYIVYVSSNILIWKIFGHQFYLNMSSIYYSLYRPGQQMLLVRSKFVVALRIPSALSSASTFAIHIHFLSISMVFVRPIAAIKEPAQKLESMRPAIDTFFFLSHSSTEDPNFSSA